MTTTDKHFEAAFAVSKELVRDFQANEAYYLEQVPGKSYQEQEARADFIDRFFIALGWDVTHAWQRNPYAQEVRIERNVNVRGKQKRADYAFFIAPDFNNERLFVEAKKPSANLENADHYFQAIRYAWNNQHPLVVLTNFRELHILDSRAKPDIATVLNKRLASFHYTDFADADKFSEIYYLLARDEVANGALEKYAAARQAAKGGKQMRQLLQSAVQKLDDSFLADLDSYREHLAKAFKRECPSLDGEVLTEIVQRTLDRLVFIRFLEDKQILADTIVDKFAHKGKGNAWNNFISACVKLAKIYNGIVFKKIPALDDYDFSGVSEVFVQVCEELSGQYTPYDFSQIPIHILGSIYERFLGKVIRATPKQVKVEEKEAVRKAGGVYYTPDYIVRYIVAQTVGAVIKGKTPEAIAQLRFADIACGSGSFLLGVLDELLSYHRQWFNDHPAAAKKQGCFKDENGQWHLPLFLKRQILLNNVYGVDLDAQAVEVAQLSLYLKLLEEETTASAYQYTLAHRELLLPTLSKNIVCGNSLIGRDIAEGQLFGDERLKDLKPMDYEYVFPQIMQAGGFDVIVGNPPYVRQESLGELFKHYVSTRFTTYASTADLYTYFIERAHRLLKPNGWFGYIVSNKFMRANYGRGLRQFLATESRLRQIVDFGELPVFAEAATFPAIIVTQRGKTAQQSFTHAAIKRLDFPSLAQEVGDVGDKLNEHALSGDSWSLAAANKVALLNKIKAAGIPLSDYVGGKIYRGILTGLNEAFVIDAETRKRLVAQNRKSAELIKPFALGDDVRFYEIRDRQRYLIFLPNGWTRQQAGNKAGWEWFAKTYPAIAAHLAPFEKRGKSRHDKGQFWWELRPCDYYDAFEKPKLVWPEIAKEPRFSFSEEPLYFLKTCFVCPVDDRFLLTLLNSKAVWLFLKQTCSVLGDADKNGRLLQQKIYLEQTPIPTASASNKSALISLAEQMLFTKQKLANSVTEQDRQFYERECSALDQQINEIVYRLYALNAEEIALVEAATA